MKHYEDQVAYSPGTVETLLPAVWDEEYILSSRMPRGESVGVKAKVDPRHVPDWILGCADVQRAFYRSGLGLAERECLKHVYHLGFTPGQLAGSWDVTAEEVHMACQTGLSKLTDYLNGRSPA